MARKHSKTDPYAGLHREEDAPATVVACWLCGRSTGKTIVWHHLVPKSWGGRSVVPMHPICQQPLMANFTNSELQRHDDYASVADADRFADLDAALCIDEAFTAYEGTAAQDQISRLQHSATRIDEGACLHRDQRRSVGVSIEPRAPCPATVYKEQRLICLAAAIAR